MIHGWDRDTGRAIAHINAGMHAISGLHVSPDGTMAVAIGPDSSTACLDIVHGRVICQFPKQKDLIIRVAWSRDSRLFFTASASGIVRQWLASAGLELRKFEGVTAGIGALVLSADEQKLIVAGRDGSVTVLNLGQGARALSFPPRTAVKGCLPVLSQDATLMAMNMGDGRVTVWDVGAQKELYRLPSDQAAAHLLAISANGMLLAIGGSASKPNPNSVLNSNPPTTLRVFGATTGKQLRDLTVPHSQLSTVVFSPNGQFLAAAIDHQIRLWNLTSANELHADRGHAHTIRTLHFTPDGAKVISTSADGTARLWDAVTGKDLCQVVGYRADLTGADVFPDGKSFIATAWNTAVQWQQIDGVSHEMRRFQNPNGPSRLSAVAISADGNRLVAATGSTIYAWDLAQDKGPVELRGSSPQLGGVNSVQSLAFSPNGRLLASSGRSTPTVIWDIQTLKAKPWSTPFTRKAPDPRTGRPPIVPTAFSAGELAFSPDGATLGLFDGSVRFLEVASGQERGRLPTLEPAAAVAFSPDGQMVATTHNGIIRFWDRLSGSELGQLSHPGSVKPLTFSPDGTKLAAADANATILVWDVKPWRKKLPRPMLKLQAQELDLLWQLLADADATRAFQAIGALAAAPEQAVTMLKEHLRPLPAITLEQMEKWIADLDRNSFAERQKASKLLEDLHEAAEPILHRTLQTGKLTLEGRRRTEQLLANLSLPNPDKLRALRAVEALERIGNAEARQLLATLASGGPGLWLTESAREARDRCEKSATVGSD